MSIIQIIFYIFNFLLFFHAAYFTIFGVWGLFRKRHVYEEASRLRHFAVLIPARNEEAVIGNLIDSIEAADYPAGLIDTFVIVNHCTDNTGTIAKERGARVIDCTADTKSKADVLRFAFGLLADERDIDAYVVFDADNIVDPAFFSEINKALDTGAPAVQARRTGKSLKFNWIASCYEMYYAMQNAYFNHPRNAAGLSASVNGTGWAVIKEVIDRNGFDFDTITEDFEMTIQYAIDGNRVAYCSRAIVYDEFTHDFRVSIVQRLRWTFGMVQCMKKYELKLLGKAMRGSFQCFDAAMLDILPLVMLLSLLSSVMAYYIVGMPVNFAVYFLVLIVTFWTAMSASSLIAMIKSGSSIKRNIKGILMFPYFILSWVPILISCFFRRKVEWTPIKHDQSVSIEDEKKAENEEDSTD